MNKDGICKRYKVTFVKNGIKYKAGDVAEVSFPIAIKFCNIGLTEATPELVADAELCGVKLVKRRIKKSEE